MKRIFTTALLALSSLAALAATTVPPQLINPSGSTAGQAIVSTGASSAPAWGAVTAGALAPVAANTVLGNFTASSAAPAAFAAPSCSTANSALKYTSGTGLSCGTTFALTSGNLSQFTATSSAQLLGVLSDETGSGLAVFGTSPSLTTPTIAGATLSGTFAGGHTYSGAVSFTSTITPSSTAGIVGTATNDLANAGSVGEEKPATTSLAGVTAGVFFNAASVIVTAGDWRCQGVADYVPAGTTTTSQLLQGISTTSATTGPFGSYTYLQYAGPAGLEQIHVTPVVPIRVASTTTVYLVSLAQFAVSTLQARGSISCTRVR